MQSVVQSQLHRIRERGVGVSAEINPFWRELVGAIDTLLQTNPEPSNAEIQGVMGYSSAPLPTWFPSNRDIWAKRGITEAVEKHDLSSLSPGDRQHAAQIHFLKRKGVLGAYVAWADSQRLYSDVNLGRLWWYAERLRETLAKLGRSHPQVILEVGGGAGGLAINLSEAGLVRHYVIADLPEMLINAMISISERVPGADMRLSETPDFSLPGPVFWFLETKEIERVAADSVDVGLNINSLMEMDEDVRDYYLAQFRRALRPGGLMYNVNRMQRAMSRRNGEPFVSNPLTYPYDPRDIVLEWEPDECQEAGRSRTLRPHPSFTISRMHLKAEPPPPPTRLQRIKRRIERLLG